PEPILVSDVRHQLSLAGPVRKQPSEGAWEGRITDRPEDRRLDVREDLVAGDAVGLALAQKDFFKPREVRIRNARLPRTLPRPMHSSGFSPPEPSTRRNRLSPILP